MKPKLEIGDRIELHPNKKQTPLTRTYMGFEEAFTLIDIWSVRHTPETLYGTVLLSRDPLHRLLGSLEWNIPLSKVRKSK